MHSTVNRLADFWWLYAVRGVLALLFGLAAIFWPGLTIAVLIAVFGVFVLVDGLMMLVVGFQARGASPNWWNLVLQGALNVVIGLVAFFAPLATALALIILVAAWAIILGVLEIVAAVRLKNVISNQWWLIASGIISILLGISLVSAPGAGIVVMAWIIGGFSLLSSLVLFFIAARLRKLKGGVSF